MVYHGATCSIMDAASRVQARQSTVPEFIHRDLNPQATYLKFYEVPANSPVWPFMLGISDKI